LGAAVLEEAKRDPEFKAKFGGILHRFLTRDYDRTFFNNNKDPFVLPPREKQNTPALALAPTQQQNEPAHVGRNMNWHR